MKLSAISNYASTIRIATPEEVVDRLSKIAIPAILVFAASKVKETQAISYVECIDNCNSHPDANPLAVLICQAICLVFCKD
ncbi:MAG: hypothetical protein P0S95_07660 [Rhabdochlamydiaceae bacterium]|nr:hypothetical protein [Candidatus Amphrikana amoebophyrae]